MSGSTRFFGGALFLILGFVFSSPVSAMTITKTGGIYSQDTADYEWSPNGTNWYAMGGASDSFCLNADCSGSPPYDLSPQQDGAGSTGETAFLRTPSGGGTDKCSFIVSGGAGTWDYAEGNTIQGSCTYVDFGGAPPDPDPVPTGFATSTGTIQSGDIPFLLGIILVLLMYFFIWHVYGKLFNIWPLS